MPLLIGRLVWHPTTPVKATSSDWYWAMIAGGGLLLIMALQFSVGMLRKKRPASAPLSAASMVRESKMPIEDWLTQAETVEIAPLAETLHGNNSKSGDEYRNEGPADSSNPDEKHPDRGSRD